MRRFSDLRFHKLLSTGTNIGGFQSNTATTYLPSGGIFLPPEGKDVVAVFDWYTCCIEHPFYDLQRITDHFPGEVDDEDAIASYMQKWEAFESSGHLRTAKALFEPLLLSQNVHVY